MSRVRGRNAKVDGGEHWSPGAYQVQEAQMVVYYRCRFLAVDAVRDAVPVQRAGGGDNVTR